MRLDNGRCFIETDNCTLLASTKVQKRGDGYGYEEDRRYHLWGTKGGKFAISMEYTEYIHAYLWCKKKSVEGHQLVEVCDTADAAITRWRYWGGETPKDMLREVA